MAYSLYLFIRDVADGDLVGWIDDRVADLDELASPDRVKALVEPLRNVYGVSDKILAMALSAILIGAADVRPRWLDVGLQLIAVDTLVHNFLHRTGILSRFKAPIPMAQAAIGQVAVADIIRLVCAFASIACRQTYRRAAV